MVTTRTRAERPSAGRGTDGPRTSAGFEEHRRNRSPLRIQHVLHAGPILGPLAVLVLAIVAFSVVNDRFLSAANLGLVLAQVTVIAVLALGQTLIILTAGIDLSVGAIAVFSSILMANLATKPALPGPLALLVGFVLGTAMGAVNGLLVTRLKLPPFIVTLGTLSIFFSLNSVVSQERDRPRHGHAVDHDLDRATRSRRRLPDHLRLDHHAAAVRGVLLRAGQHGVGQARLRHRRRRRGRAAGRHPHRPGAAVGLHGGRACSTPSAPGSSSAGSRRRARTSAWSTTSTPSPPSCSAAPACSAAAAACSARWSVRSSSACSATGCSSAGVEVVWQGFAIGLLVLVAVVHRPVDQEGEGMSCHRGHSEPVAQPAARRRRCCRPRAWSSATAGSRPSTAATSSCTPARSWRSSATTAPASPA